MGSRKKNPKKGLKGESSKKKKKGLGRKGEALYLLGSAKGKKKMANEGRRPKELGEKEGRGSGEKKKGERKKLLRGTNAAAASGIQGREPTFRLSRDISAWKGGRYHEGGESAEISEGCFPTPVKKNKLMERPNVPEDW